MECMVIGKLSAPVLLEFEPVGRWFESRDSHVRVLSGGVAYSEDTDSDSSEGEGWSGEDLEVDPLQLDPIQWKDQDHYAVLGLGKLRYKATNQDIRKAYRQKVLQHHPDKQHLSGQDLEVAGDDHFKCIMIAYDILADPKRRRGYDSVDPLFDEVVPTVSANSREHFFELFGPIFEENARWSTKQPVPALGDPDSSLEEIEAFYAFWYDLSSWREFSYLDEENPKKAESREERRWLEKLNKTVRQKRKKEEVARIRTLVDNAYVCDPRVKKFKEAEKAEKLAKKKAREEAVKREALQRERELQRKVEEERKLKEKQEEEARAQAAQAKREKEAAKKVLKKERKNFRAVCKSHNYFASGEGEVVGRMEEVERVCEGLSLERLQELNEAFVTLSVGEARSIFEEEVAALRRQEEAQLAAAQAKASQPPTAHPHPSSVVDGDWNREEVQLLVKAVSQFPPGTVRRWETIAGFVNTHSSEGCVEKTARQVVSKVKQLQRLDSSEKAAENKEAFSRFEKEHSKKGLVEAMPTKRYDAPKPWTAEEQKLLEKALRTYPANTPERWDKVTAMVGSRSKAECVTRFKELVARVKAKRQQS